MITTSNVNRVESLILKDFEEDLSTGVFSSDKVTTGHDYNPIVTGFIYNETGIKILSGIDKYDSFYILHQYALDENGARTGKFTHRIVSFDAIVKAYKIDKAIVPIILSSAISNGTADVIEVYKTVDAGRYILRITTSTTIPVSETNPDEYEKVVIGQYELLVPPMVKISQALTLIASTPIAVEDLSAT